MDSVSLMTASPFSDGLDLLKEVDVSVIFALFSLGRLTPDLSRVLKLTTRLESTALERVTTISLERKSDMSVKGNIVRQKVFPFLFVLLKLEFNTQDRYFASSALSNAKEI